MDVQLLRPSRRDLLNEILLVAGVAAVQLVGSGLAAHHHVPPQSIPVAGWALLVAGVVVLPLRHRHPVVVLVVTFATTGVYALAGYPGGPIWAPLIVSVAQCIITGHRKAAIASLVAGVAYFPWVDALARRGGSPSLGSVLGLGAWLLVLLAVIELVRARRQHDQEEARLAATTLERQVAEERVRIARDLHDAVAHSMSLINIQAGVALHLIDERPEQAREALTTIKSASKDALVELRSILGVLRQVDEDAPRLPAPSLGRLDELVQSASLSGVDVDLEVVGNLDHLPLNVDLAAYRILQESLTNVARHAEGARATVRIRSGSAMLALEVLDDGPGIGSAGATPSGGNGIAGMYERALSVGGRLQAEPRPKRGFAVRADLPVGRPA